jgi:hypothetical protein
MEKDTLTASEAIFGFCGWLTTRAEKTLMSGVDDASPVVELIERFCDKNNLKEPREDWANNLKYPEVIRLL